MEDDKEYLGKVTDAIEAAHSFLNTDAAYGSHDSRTGAKKDRLAQAIQALSAGNVVEVPHLSIVPDDGPEMDKGTPGFQPPSPDPQRWTQVRAYLTRGCELPSRWVDALHDDGKIYADVRGNAVFIGENERREASVAYVHGIGAPSPDPTAHRQPGWFTVRLPAEEAGHRPVLILAESPVDALSALEMHRRIYRDRPDGRSEHGPVTVMATEGAGPAPHWAITETLRLGGTVRVATDNTPTGELIWQHLREQYSSQGVDRFRPWAKDWNDVLRFHNACYRDPQAADRQLHELWRQNAPDERSRAAVHEAVRRWGPARTPDAWER